MIAFEYKYDNNIITAGKLLFDKLWFSFDNYYIIKKNWFSSQKYRNLQSKRNIKLIDFNKSKTIKRIREKKNNDVYGFFFKRCSKTFGDST